MRAFALMIFLFVVIYSVSTEDDPEAHMSALEMIKHWDYPAEHHDVIAKDGYILSLFRIPHGRLSQRNTSCHRPPILLVHGFVASSSCWIANPPESSPGFLLADAGFDVFLANVRGTTYSKRHITLAPWENKFWQYTLDELAKYDVTAMIDKVLEITGQSSLYYLGHSQGTEIGFMALAELPEYNEKIKAFFQLAPPAAGSHFKGIGSIARVLYPAIKPLADAYRLIFGSHELLWQWSFLYRGLVRLCNAVPYAGPVVCQNALSLLFGPSTRQLDMSRLPVYMSHAPNGVSTWQILHWAQILIKNEPVHMDHNPLENIQRYGQEKHLIYNFTNIKAPVYWFWSRDDWLATPADTEDFTARLLKAGVVKGGVEIRGYDHKDYLIAPDVWERVYGPITMIVKKQERKMCLQ